MVFGEIGDPSEPAILFYFHHDGQPVNPASWQQANPWQPVVRTNAIEAGRTVVSEGPASAARVDPQYLLYARSASDDKAPIIVLLQILDAWKAAGIGPPNHLKLIFEGDEETGSRYLARTAARYRDCCAPISPSWPTAPSTRADADRSSDGAGNPDSAPGSGEPVAVPTMGGSGPAYVFTDILRMPFVVMPIVNRDNNRHAANENVRLANLFKGMEILGAAASARLPAPAATP